MNNEILITDLSNAVIEKDSVSASITLDKWRVMEYETAKYSGTMLYATPECMPKDVTIPLNLKGKYYVYLGMFKGKGSTPMVSLRLTSEDEIFLVTPETRYQWTPLETAVEYFWREVELNGEGLVLSKPKDYLPHHTALAWIRLVPVTREFPKKNPLIAYHLDSDYFSDDDYKTPNSITGFIDYYKDGGADVILQETFAHTSNVIENLDHRIYKRAGNFVNFHKHKKDFEKALIKKAHDIGAKIYGTYRLQAGEFVAPSDSTGINYVFAEDFSDVKEYSCVSRDGRVLGMASYAYENVRKKMINSLLNILSVGYDGLSLVFNRGTFVAFEQPVLDKVKELYGVDARTLPMKDERYKKVACSFVTEFMRELNKAVIDKFGQKKDINVIVFFTPEESENNGFDVKTWVNEGLVSSVSQGLMTIYEDLDGCVNETGLVDLEKYKQKLLEKPTIVRKYRSNDFDYIVSGAKSFMEICNGKVDFYATLLWQAHDDADIIKISDMLKNAGVKKFISWNANHRAKILNRANTEKFYVAGSKEEYETKKSNYYRVLSINGIDVSQFNPSWKG